jgi:cell division protein FtsQ
MKKKYDFPTQTSLKKRWMLWRWSGIFLLLLLLVGFAESDRRQRQCKEIHIEIDHGIPSHHFITENEVYAVIHSPHLNPMGKKLSDINMAVLESSIGENPFVENAEVFSTIDGRVIFKITQRNPLMRIINRQNEQYYVDTQGGFMPLCATYTADVPLATNVPNAFFKMGAISTTSPPDSFTVLHHLFQIARFIVADQWWNAFVQQLHVNEQDDIELIPRIGDHVIVLGSAERLEEKLENLKYLYTHGFRAIDGSRYSVINLKFRNQIVCTKKNQ